METYGKNNYFTVPNVLSEKKNKIGCACVCITCSELYTFQDFAFSRLNQMKLNYIILIS